MEAIDPEYVHFKNGKAITLKEIQQKLQNITIDAEISPIAIDYYRDHKNLLHIFLITKENIFHEEVSLGTALDIWKQSAEKITDFMEFEITPEILEEYAQYLLPPSILQKISASNAKRIYFSPSGFLHNFPFHILPIGKNQWFGTEFELIRLPNLSAIAKEHKPAIHTFSSMLALGLNHEDMNNKGFEKIARKLYKIFDDLSLNNGFFTRLKKIIIKIFSGSDLYNTHNLILGEDATVRHFFEKTDTEKFDVINIVCHGELDAKIAALRLFGDPLTVKNIVAHKITSELLITTACIANMGETREDGASGDEVEGLLKACMFAGVRSILISLWKINPTTAEEFIGTVCRYLVEGRLTKAQIYQKTLKQYLQSDDPRKFYRYAGFSLVGG